MADNNNTNNNTNITNDESDIRSLLSSILANQNKILEKINAQDEKIEAICRHIGLSSTVPIDDYRRLLGMFHGASLNRCILPLRQIGADCIDVKDTAFTEDDNANYSAEEVKDHLTEEYKLAFTVGKAKSFSWVDMQRLAIHVYKGLRSVLKIPVKFKSDIRNIKYQVKPVTFEIIDNMVCRKRRLVRHNWINLPPTAVQDMAFALEDQTRDYLPLSSCIDNWGAKEILKKYWSEGVKLYLGKI